MKVYIKKIFSSQPRNPQRTMQSTLSGNKISPELHSILKDNDLEDRVEDLQGHGILTEVDLPTLFSQDENFFGDDGFSKTNFEIVRDVLQKYDPNRDPALNMQPGLRTLQVNHDLLRESFVIEQADILSTSDLYTMWGSKEYFYVQVGTCRFNLEPFREDLSEYQFDYK